MLFLRDIVHTIRLECEKTVLFLRDVVHRLECKPSQEKSNLMGVFVVALMLPLNAVMNCPKSSSRRSPVIDAVL